MEGDTSLLGFHVLQWTRLLVLSSCCTTRDRSYGVKGLKGTFRSYCILFDYESHSMSWITRSSTSSFLQMKCYASVQSQHLKQLTGEMVMEIP